LHNMAEYKEVAITGTRWTRTNKIVISIDEKGAASVRFYEEQITTLSDGTTTNRPTETLPSDIDAGLVASLIAKYRQVAEDRDNRPPPVEVVTPE